jgi:acyl carrier protein
METKRAVTEALSMILQRKGRNAQIHEGANVLQDLGLDSADGVEIACVLEDILGIKIPQDANPLIDDANQRGRTVEELCDWIDALPAEAVTQ